MPYMEFTQYILPHGRKTLQYFECDDEILKKYEFIKKKGMRFEVEILTNGEVSLTIFNVETEVDEFIELCSNGPVVREAISRLVDAGYERWRHDEADNLTYVREQVDCDGVKVAVSCEALDQTLEYLSWLESQLEGLTRPETPYQM